MVHLVLSLWKEGGWNWNMYGFLHRGPWPSEQFRGLTEDKKVYSREMWIDIWESTQIVNTFVLHIMLT